jgi:hypothetical protein
MRDKEAVQSSACNSTAELTDAAEVVHPSKDIRRGRGSQFPGRNRSAANDPSDLEDRVSRAHAKPFTECGERWTDSLEQALQRGPDGLL